MNDGYIKLAFRIGRFLPKYGKRGADGEWNGPDSDMLDSAAEMLRNGVKPNPWSEWGSGCYSPYNDEEGRKEHDDILEAIRNLD